MKTAETYRTILWRIDPLLGKDLETNNETTAVAMQRRREQASTTVELLLETAFSAWSVPKSYLEDNWGDPLSCQLTELDESLFLHGRLCR
jgi:hypothetical protein